MEEYILTDEDHLLSPVVVVATGLLLLIFVLGFLNLIVGSLL